MMSDRQGLHTMQAEADGENPTYDRALVTFVGQVGAAGRAILRAMLNNGHAWACGALTRPRSLWEPAAGRESSRRRN